MYIAKHYVSFKDFTATPGEYFEAELTKEAEERLIKLGAVEKVQETPELVEPVEEPVTETVEAADETEAEAAQAPEAAPEIDVMAAFTKPAAKRTRKK